MRWDHNVAVVAGGGATADPLAAPATVPVANTFRIRRRDPQSDRFNERIMFALTGAGVAAGEWVAFELWQLDERDESDAWGPAATDRWTRVCTVDALGGGKVAGFEPFSGGGTGSRGGVCYLRIIGEALANNREIMVAAMPGGAAAPAGGVVSGGIDDYAGPLWPDAVPTPTDPTAAGWVVSTVEFQVMEATTLIATATIANAVTGLDLDGLLIRVDRSIDFGAAWEEVGIVTVPLAALGAHRFTIDLPSNGLYRLAAIRFGGDANTTLIIAGEIVSHRGELGHDQQAIELTNAKEVGGLCWDNAGAAEALTLNFAASTSDRWIPVGRANRAKAVATLTNGPSTTIEAQIHQSPLVVGGPTDTIEELTNWVAGNIRNYGPAEHQGDDGANGDHTFRFSVDPGTMIALYMKYTAPLGPSDCIITLYLWREEEE